MHKIHTRFLLWCQLWIAWGRGETLLARELWFHGLGEGWVDQDGSVSHSVPFFRLRVRGVQVQFVLVWATFHVLTSWKNYYYIIILSTSNSAQGDCVCACVCAVCAAYNNNKFQFFTLALAFQLRGMGRKGRRQPLSSLRSAIYAHYARWLNKFIKQTHTGTHTRAHSHTYAIRDSLPFQSSVS